MSSLISKPLATIFSEFERQWQNTAYPQVDYDAKWLSPCIIGEPLSQVVSWHPVIRDIAGDFSGIEAALELQIHPSIKAFYGDYFSEILAVDFQDNTIELVQAWNDQDFDMLLENIIGHVLMQRRLKQAETVFIASTEDEMQVVSINNNSGEIVLEQLGKGVDRVLASTLEEFLAQLSLAK
ncbi:SecY-interacting protein [Agarivorans sp. MS3-6]|uniref:SecY-interacting protein n=1 Tax=Agarivorans sp. TSD2052 TaxID=2937286 RepID=UPI00200EC2F3|nr:SecY-interacting protein [Agarivorans sp. TSD2052]UPW17164.1 SecY-interacting protein [Agarivorans sp. TSD2052]